MELHVIHEVVTWNNNATNATAAPNVNLSIPRSIFVDINGWLCVLLFVVSMVGIFCNCLGFLVALQPAFRRVPIAPFLICMSITDTVFLYTAVINTSWMFLKGGPIPGPTAMCNIRRLLSTVSGASSALVLATLSAQRFCCLLVPHKVKPWLKTRLSVATVCVIVGSSVAAFSPILWAVAADSSCKVQPGWETYFAYTYSGMAMTTYTIIPDATMMVTNSWTMRELIRINRLRGQVHPATAGTAAPYPKYIRMVMTLASSHLLLTLPMLLLRAYQFHTGVVQLYKSGLGMAALENALLLLMALNHSVNFMLCVHTSSNYRQALRQLSRFFGRKRQVGPAANN